MAKVRIELNSAGIRAFLKSGPVRDMLAEIGSQVASAAGSGYEAESGSTEQRAKVRIHAATFAARRDCLKNNTLLKALRNTRA